MSQLSSEKILLHSCIELKVCSKDNILKSDNCGGKSWYLCTNIKHGEALIKIVPNERITNL